METLGINANILMVQLIPLMILIGLPIISLFDLRKKNLSGVTLAVWVLIVCAIPLIGSLAYWIVKPSAEKK